MDNDLRALLVDFLESVRGDVIECGTVEQYHSIAYSHGHWLAIVNALESALSAPALPGRVPDGWKLVPMEPTVAMKIAGDNAGWWCADKYRAMLAVAPVVGEEERG